MAELIVAIEHSKRNRIPVEKLIEEMADVKIILNQMKRSEKLERRHQTIENDKRPPNVLISKHKR